MADLRRLGKRGSYRLGQLGAPAGPGRRRPTAQYPSFARGHRAPVVVWLLACAATTVAVAAGALAGWWFLPFLAGLAAGLVARWGRWRLQATLPAVTVITGGGWGAALGWLAWLRLPERAVAREIAALAGLPAHATVAIAVTLLVAVAQGLAGLWLGRALLPGHGVR